MNEPKRCNVYGEYNYEKEYRFYEDDSPKCQKSDETYDDDEKGTNFLFSFFKCKKKNVASKFYEDGSPKCPKSDGTY